MSFTKFLKNSRVTIKGIFKLFGCLVVLFPPCAIILENKSDAQGMKSLLLRMYLVTRRTPENIDTENLDGILLDKWGIRTIKN